MSRPSLLGITLILSMLGCGIANAYPEFISYGYTSCLTCHYNSQGNGPLNDYGRALFSAEISSRSWISKSITDDTLGENSGFLGKKELPWWFRPGIKFRGLFYQSNPGGPGSQLRYAPMQKEFNAAIFFDRDQNYGFVGTLGSQLGQNGFQGNEVWIGREYYLRLQPITNFWIFLGVLDKVFGIRHVDHTMYSRSGAGLDAHSAYKGRLTHGAVVHLTHRDFDLATHVFVGNLMENEGEQPKGFSVSGEYATGEQSRTGLSYLSQNNSKLETKETKYAVHERLGVSQGTSLLAEVGYLNTTINNEVTNATYAFVETQALFSRGRYAVSMIEYLKREGSDETKFRWGVGLLIFPFPRAEYRIMAIDERTMVPQEGRADRWQFQFQLHLSL